MELICLDTSVLIEYYRKTNKNQTFLYKLATKFRFAVPTIVQYEILRGDSQKDVFWVSLFSRSTILPFDETAAQKAAEIYSTLKKINRLPGTDDVLIAATAQSNKMKLATINKKHFQDVPNLGILFPDSF